MSERTPRPASWERTVSVAVLLLAIRNNRWKITHPDEWVVHIASN